MEIKYISVIPNCEVLIKTYYKNGIPYNEKTIFKLKKDLIIEAYEIKEGYESDGGSIPRFLWSILAPSGKHLRATLLHDWLYDNRISSRKKADELFLQIMLEDKVVKWKAYIMYYGVRLFANYKWIN